MYIHSNWLTFCCWGITKVFWRFQAAARFQWCKMPGQRDVTKSFWDDSTLLLWNAENLSSLIFNSSFYEIFLTYLKLGKYFLGRGRLPLMSATILERPIQAYKIVRPGRLELEVSETSRNETFSASRALRHHLRIGIEFRCRLFSRRLGGAETGYTASKRRQRGLAVYANDAKGNRKGMNSCKYMFERVPSIGKGNVFWIYSVPSYLCCWAKRAKLQWTNILESWPLCTVLTTFASERCKSNHKLCTKEAMSGKAGFFVSDCLNKVRRYGNDSHSKNELFS